jgi:Transglycosylase SLT domain
MTRYTYAQLEEIWIQGGGSKGMAPLMAAIAEVESGGNPDAENASGATGLWQIEWPLHQGIVPGANSRQALHNPLVNAQAARVLSGNNPSVSAGSPVYSNWLEWEPAGAYLQYLKSGVAPGSVTVTGGQGGGGIFGAIDNAVSALGGAVTNPADIASSLTSIASSFAAIGTIAGEAVKAFEWLFVPSHWVRIMAFGAGAALLFPGISALMKAGSGQSGDVTLALGILLTVLAGMLLFIAFHNLPEDVRNLSDLLGWISRSIQQGAAAV